MASFSYRILQSNVTRHFPRLCDGFRRMARDRGLPSVGAIKYADDLIVRMAAARGNGVKGERALASKTRLEIVHRDDSAFEGFINRK